MTVRRSKNGRRLGHIIGSVYLVHFARPHHGAQHYLGFSTNITQRIKAHRAGITKRIGWHTFRHTFATLLQASGAGIRVSQELMRHSSPVMTLGTYTQAVTEEKRLAQARVAALFADIEMQPTTDTAA